MLCLWWYKLILLNSKSLQIYELCALVFYEINLLSSALATSLRKYLYVKSSRSNSVVIYYWLLKLMYVTYVLQELGNNIERSKNNQMLQQILTPATIMVVSVTASTTQG